ncbi:patatin-like phospholipase family protein [Paenibacillus oenotherae]|uniref:Patatin-like phospholipase family protein n=1 Tax=Paenibacillus oenotherae TaxID=1435645 RepID=A0ABS7D767_9BACL|nr:CBASS cGAMP-activated phospholipase [Paenibacillus oenotherae]MBW7475674.1 patatin-like phospholipase family protein [Paenibacillus oenotherae]
MKRILSIDGGGIKGVFPAAILKHMEEQLPNPISRYFDLIVGTSTGGIIALALGLGLSGREIVSFYEIHGPRIFIPKKKGLFSGLVHKASFGYSDMIFDTKYEANLLKSALAETFEGLRIGDSHNRLVIPSFNIQTGSVHIFKTRHHERFEKDWRVPAVEAGLATSAAPIYFDTFRTASGVPLVDGGVFANNPVGLAVVEAIGVLGWKPEEIQVLSLGCTHEAYHANLEKPNLGYKDWGPQGLTELFMRAQDSASLGTAMLLAGHPIHNNVYRLSKEAPPKLYTLDGVNRIDLLKSLAADVAREEIAKLRKLGFFDQPAEAFVPIPMPNVKEGVAG